jgi:hypothetical protein
MHPEPPALLLIDWLNQRYDARFSPTDVSAETIVASDGHRRAAISTAPLWEDAPAWQERLSAMEERLAGSAEGSYILWVPPRADLPLDEPGASYFVRRVEHAVAAVHAGARTEVTFPVTIRLAKLRDEGGYASVAGGLSRWWTRITENVQGTFAVDSNAVHRLTSDGAAREELWSTIGRLSNGIATGQSGEFEIEEAWTLQRLVHGPRGVHLVGAPPSVDPNDGVLIRRMGRKRLTAANETLAALDVDLHVFAFLGAYEYMEVETATGTVKAIDPSLFAQLQIVALVADGDVKPIFAPPLLPA